MTIVNYIFYLKNIWFYYILVLISDGGKIMKSSRIMKIFEQYVRKYDMNNINIKARYFHSLKVMEIVKDLATELGIFTEEEIARGKRY